MDISISLIEKERSDMLESLNDWLRGEAGLTGKVRMSGPAPAVGELGAAAEVLVVAVGSGGTLSVLAASLHAWLSQPRRSEIKIKIQGSNGRVVDITADRIDAKHTEALLRQALDFTSSEE
jgi:Effector Associated Constant Component 1